MSLCNIWLGKLKYLYSSPSGLPFWTRLEPVLTCPVSTVAVLLGDGWFILWRTHIGG